MKITRFSKQTIQWIVYGPFEKELSPNFQPTDNLELVYDVQALQIYQVK
jgi:hypothetical protein